MKKMMFLFYLMLPLLLYGQQPEVTVLSLNECINLGLSNNLKLKQARMESDKSRYQLQEAVSAGLPKVSSYASFDDYFDIPVNMVSGEILGQPGTMVPIQLGTRYNATAGIQAGQMIYNAAFFESVRLFRKACEISNLNLEQYKEELAYNLAQIYLFIQTTNKQLSLIDSNLVAFTKIYDYSAQHYNNGLIRKTDLDRVTVAIHNMETERDNLLLTRNQQLNMLKYLTGIDQDHNIILSDEIDFISFPCEYTDTIFNNQIDIRLLEQKKELADINLHLTRASNVPSLSGYAAFSYMAPVEKLNRIDNKDNWYKTSFVGLKLTIPIFEGNKVRSKLKQNQIEINQLQTSQKDLRSELSVRLKNVSDKLRTNREMEVRLKTDKELAGNVLNITSQQYGLGLKSFTDVLNARYEYNTAHLSWLNSLLQIKLSELEIAKIQGNINTIIL